MHPPLGAALALLVALASLTGSAAPAILLAIVLVIVAMVSMGWPDVLELPSALGTRIVMATTGALSAILAFSAPGPLLAMEAVASVCALGIFGSFLHQMARRSRTDLTTSLTGTVAGAMLTGLAGCWIRAQQEVTADAAHGGLLTTTAIALSAALLMLALPIRRLATGALAIIGGATTAAAVLPTLAPHIPLWLGLLAGAVVGLTAAAVQSLLDSSLVARDPVPALTVAAAPIATAGVIVLLVARAGELFTR